MKTIPELRWFQRDAAAREAIRQQLSQQLASHDEIAFAYLLGSFQQGLPFRDIDVAVYMEPECLKRTDALRYSFRLADELERAIPYPVDVRILNDAPCGFCYNATRGALLLSRNEVQRLEWVVQTWQEYLDFEPHLNFIGRAWIRQLCEGTEMDKQVLIKRIGALRENLDKVRQIVASESEQRLLEDAYKMAALKWHLLLAIEDAFALCSHVVARLGGDAPTSYAECFEILHRHGTIEASLLDRLRAMARFRNLLIHRYCEVDDQRVIEICRNDLVDLEAFAAAIATHFGLPP